MRVLHSAALLRPPIGILRQMKWEQDAAVENKFAWDVRMYCPPGAAPMDETIVCSPKMSAQPGGRFRKLLHWICLRYTYHQWLLKQQSKYDVFLLRYYVHDPFQLMFMWRVKRPVCFVNHTLEVPELSLSGQGGALIRASLERLIGPYCLRRASAIIAVTDEIALYEAKRSGLPVSSTIIYPNGVVYGPPALDERGALPTILFIASGFAAWHGLDLLLASIEKTDAKFALHIVGDVNTLLTDQVSGDPRIILHGRLDSLAICRLAAKCHIALSSFALFRQKMKQACTLKVREYLMLGLPVYAGHQDVFPDDFAYYRHGPCDMGEILEYLEQHRADDRERVAAAATQFIDKSLLLQNLYEKLKTTL